MLATVTEDPLMLPWDAVGKATAYEYYRKSRYFLAFAGYLDPKLTEEFLQTGMSSSSRRGHAEIAPTPVRRFEPSWPIIQKHLSFGVCPAGRPS
jgi:hypothetical protein